MGCRYMCSLAPLIVAAAFIGCETQSGREHSGGIRSPRANPVAAGAPLVDPSTVLAEGMDEIEVAAALSVTAIDRKTFLWGGPLGSKTYICCGDRFPSRFIKCTFDMVWKDESNDLVAWKLRQFSLIEGKGAVLEINVEPVQGDYAVECVRHFAEQLKTNKAADDN